MIVLFIILLICTNPWFQNKVANMCGKENPTELTGFLIALFFGAILWLLKSNHLHEPFLFKVSEFNPRCGGLYVGKPTTFQYDRIGCNYNVPVSGNNPDMIKTNGKSIQPYCTPEANPPLGYIAHDKSQLYDGDPGLFPNFGDK